MTDVVGVVFNKGGKTYYFDPAGLDLDKGTQVVVQTMRGLEVGKVVDAPHEVPDDEIPAQLKRVVRIAAEEDMRILDENEQFKREAMQTCRELIEKHNLKMKLVDAELAFGGGKITFSFFAEERVDFRALVADLARTLKMRIELRQIGAREEARLIGGLGPCGRRLCCQSFRVSQDPVSIRMAKEQQLPLNPSKISGICGRLMCCLKYEQEQYVEFRKSVPKCGTKVETSQGVGTIVSHKVPRDAVTVRFGDGSEMDFPVVTCNCGDEPCRVIERCPNEPDTAPPPVKDDAGDPLAASAAGLNANLGGGGRGTGKGAGAGAGGSGSVTIKHGERPQGASGGTEAAAGGESDGGACDEPAWKHQPNDDPGVDPASLGDDAEAAPGAQGPGGAEGDASEDAGAGGREGAGPDAGAEGGKKRNRRGRSRRRRRKPKGGGERS